MDLRKTISIILVLVVASFFLGRFTGNGSTFLAATESNKTTINQDQQFTLDWLKQANPLDYATYNVSYLNKDFDENSGITKQVKFFAGSYRFSNEGGYSLLEGSTRGDLDGDSIDEGVVMKFGRYGGTGSFPELVVLKKTGSDFIEFASTDQPTEFFDDRINVQSIAIEKGIITVSIIGKGPDDGACCPTVPMEKRFRLVDGKIQPVI